MTVEQAIEKLIYARQNADEEFDWDLRDALDMAIGTLRSRIEGDCIRRDAAIGTMIDLHNKLYTSTAEIRSTLNSLPSVNPTKWISISERLPEEKINPITRDYYQYPCIFKSGDVRDIRYYKFGRGHWWNCAQMMDQYVTAWMELPELYEEVDV